MTDATESTGAIGRQSEFGSQLRDDELTGADPSEVFRRGGPAVLGRRALRRGRELLGDNPAFLPIVLRLTPLGMSRKITDATDVVIEGFPRSSNTFATFALLEAQDRPTNVASHAHVPAQVKLAVRLGKPTLLVIREPLGCLTSLLSAAPHIRFESAIKEYTHHHQQLLAWRDGFIVSTFEETTSDFGSVTKRLNARFGTDFVPFEHTPESAARVFERIDEHYRSVYGDQASERVVPRPSAARGAEKEWLTAQFESARYADLMSRARAVYAELTEAS